MRPSIAAASTLETVLIIDPPSTTAAGTAPSRQLKSLLRVLGTGECTKEALIRDVWGYKYHPSRHDPLIHQAMAKLRDVLGESGRWLEFTGNGYRMHPSVQILLAVGAEVSAGIPPEPSWAAPEDGRSDLGPRGGMILEYLKKHRFIDAKIGVALFQVSRVTASRDLALLHKKKAIRRFGSGRTTRYELGNLKG